jgi:hypothetical protein
MKAAGFQKTEKAKVKEASWSLQKEPIPLTPSH